MGNIGTTATILLIVVLFLGGIFSISNDLAKNKNLDNNSKLLLIDLGAEYNNNFDAGSSFTTTTNNLTGNQSNCLGVDPFFKQSCLDKQEVTSKESTAYKILKLPSLFLKMFGVENETILILWSSAIYSFLTFMISLQLYKAFRTGEVD